MIASDPAGPILLHLFNLENRIRDPRSGAKYDFTMCNPPFYSSREDVLHSAEVKESEPTAVRFYRHLGYPSLSSVELH